jgi:hypothetical protein
MYTHACIQIPVQAELVDGGAPARLARICQPRELRGMCLRGGAKGFDNKMLKADHPKDCIAHTDHTCDLDVFFLHLVLNVSLEHHPIGLCNIKIHVFYLSQV